MAENMHLPLEFVGTLDVGGVPVEFTLEFPTGPQQTHCDLGSFDEHSTLTFHHDGKVCTLDKRALIKLWPCRECYDFVAQQTTQGRQFR